MIRQHLNLFYRLQRVNKSTRRIELLIRVGQSRYKHMPDPHRDAMITQIPRTIKDIFIAPARQLLVLLVINLLDIKKHRIRKLRKFFKLREKRLLPRKRLRRRIKAGIDSSRLRLPKKLQHKINLHQRIPAAHRDTTFIAPIFTISLRKVKKLGSRPHIIRPEIPGIRIMTIPTPHMTALQENHKPNSRPVHTSKCFNRMYCSFDLFCHRKPPF